MDLSWRLKRIEEALGINDSWSEPSPAEIARSQELSALCGVSPHPGQMSRVIQDTDVARHRQPFTGCPKPAW